MAGAPIKKGLSWVELDFNINQDPKVELLEAEFGLKGFAMFIKLLIRIYEDEGYFMEWDKDTQLLLAKRVGEPGPFVGEVVKGAVRRGLFNKSVFDNFGVLTSSAIQRRYLKATKRRDQVELIGEYLTIDINADIEADNVCIKWIDARNNSQSRVEKSKEEESRVKGAPAWKHTPPDDLLQVEGFAEVWADWEEHRRAIGKKMTKVAAERIWKRLLKWDYDPVAILNRSIENGWTGIFEPGKQKHGANNKRKTKGDEAVEFLTGNWN